MTSLRKRRVNLYGRKPPERMRRVEDGRVISHLQGGLLVASGGKTRQSFLYEMRS